MNKMNVRIMTRPDYFVQTELDRLRINVGFTGTDKKVLMVTSSQPNEGKSFIATNLWLELAKAGNRVCLLDADMRKSDLRRALRLTAVDGGEFMGLSHYLAGYASAESVIYSTDMEGACLIPTLTQINPSLLLEGERLNDLIALLRQAFDYVIIDTPPIGAVSDGLMIASKCDGCVFVVRAHETSRSTARKSIQLIEGVNCPVLGVVLNRVEDRRTRGYYAKSYYSKGYGAYYASSEAAASANKGKSK